MTYKPVWATENRQLTGRTKYCTYWFFGWRERHYQEVCITEWDTNSPTMEERVRYQWERYRP